MNEGIQAKFQDLLDSHAKSHSDRPKILTHAEFLQLVNTLNRHARVPYRSATVELARKIKLKTHLISELERIGYTVLE